MILGLIIFGLLIVGVVAFFLFSNYQTKKRHARFGREDVVAALEEFVSSDSGYLDEWDLFLAWPIDDPYLESIRQRCIKVYAEYPPTRPGEEISTEGVEQVHAILKELRGPNQ